MNRKLLALIVVVLLAGLAGCTAGDAPDKESDTDATTNGTIVYDNVNPSDDVTRFTDKEAGVVCYYFANPNGYAGQGGLSCVPMNETHFAEGEQV